MTDDAIRAWLEEEIDTEGRHIATAASEARSHHCRNRRAAFQRLLDVLNRANGDSPNLWARAMGAK